MLGHASREASPIFTQFLDCVFQLTLQFKHAFEVGARVATGSEAILLWFHQLNFWLFPFQFTPAFLVSLHTHILSCRFGTFVCNTERERREGNHGEVRTTVDCYLRRIPLGLVRVTTFTFSSHMVLISFGNLQRTRCLWRFLQQERAQFINEEFEPNGQGMLEPDCAVDHLRLWLDMYLPVQASQHLIKRTYPVVGDQFSAPF